METNEQIDIVICMGSSCFARGNKKNLEFIENLLESGDIGINLGLSGNRCEKKCDKGPNIQINGMMYSNINTQELEKIILKIKNKSR